jgi:DNA-binding transcriptional LysR family regulator
MNWDDLRYVLVLARAGSLSRAAKELTVDHTTVGRRIDAIEADLGLKLFTRTTSGYVCTAEAERLLPEMRRVEDAVFAVERNAHREHEYIDGIVRVTSGETFGASYLAPRLARLGQEHPNLAIELITGGTVLDLSRREADVAVRFFRSKHETLVVRKVGEVAHALYASRKYLAKHPFKELKELKKHPLLVPTPGANVVETKWVERMTDGARPAFVCTLTSGLVEAAKIGAGIAVLPRYLADRERSLRRIPMADEPREPLWLTVHRDVKTTRRVRVVLDFLSQCFESDRALLAGLPNT